MLYINYALVKLSNSLKRWGWLHQVFCWAVVKMKWNQLQALGISQAMVPQSPGIRISPGPGLSRVPGLALRAHTARAALPRGTMRGSRPVLPDFPTEKEAPAAGDPSQRGARPTGRGPLASLAECHGSSAHTFPGEETAQGRGRARAPNPARRYRHTCLPSR